jgi:DNA-directed RNA polymerase sigma subunit (sigma70/sigma32)
MLKHLKSTKQQTLEHIAKNIELDMKQLSNEMKFLTKLSVMNDIIADDMDSRILQLLEAKKMTKKFKIDFKVSNQNMKNILSTSNKIFDKNRGVLFEKKINSLFQNKKPLGTLQLYLPLKELDRT